MPHLRVALSIAVLCPLGWNGCTDPVRDRLEGTTIPAPGAQALERLRFTPLVLGDEVGPAELILCGHRERVLLALSRRLVLDYLGIDGPVMLPEVFPHHTDTEVFLEVGENELFRLTIPRGIAAKGPHPSARVRELDGQPIWSPDLAQVQAAFGEGEAHANRPEPRSSPADLKPDAIPRATPQLSNDEPRRVGIRPFPRMGPRNGVVVQEVIPASPAAGTDLKTGDRIVAVNTIETLDLATLRKVVTESRGDTIVLTVKRNGLSRHVKVDMARPEIEPSPH